MEVLGYKFNTEKEAIQAVNALNSFWKLPKENGQSEFDLSIFSTWGGGFWCNENKYWYLPALGEPYKFEVPNP